MNEDVGKVKKINSEKLEKMSDQDLLEKIKSKEAKIKLKKDYYDSLHKINMQRFESYKKSKEELAQACTFILNKRKNQPQSKLPLNPLVEKKINP